MESGISREQVTTPQLIIAAMKDTIWTRILSRDVPQRNDGTVSLQDAVSEFSTL